MKIKLLLILSLILTACASIPEDQDPQIDQSPEEILQSLINEAERVLSLPTNSSNGKLKMVKNSISTRHIYYPTNEDLFYSVQMDEKLDTAMIIVTYLNDNQVQIVNSLSYENGKAYRWSSFEYIYNSEDRLDEIYSSNSTKPKALLAKYHYDSKNHLVEIEYPYESGAELLVYKYDEFNRIANEWKSARGQENHQIDFLVYRYNNGLLVAKESGIRGTITDDRQDAFQYFYDPQGKLVQSKEYDPYFGFQKKETVEYFYY